jgi:hypothetical protein
MVWTEPWLPFVVPTWLNYAQIGLGTGVAAGRWRLPAATANWRASDGTGYANFDQRPD